MLGVYNIPNESLQHILNVLESCEKSNLTDLLNHLRELYESLKKAVDPLNKLRIEGKKYAINKIFEILSQNYIYQEREKILLNFEAKPEKIGIDDYIWDSIIPKIDDLIINHKGIFTLELNLSSKKITELVYNILKTHLKAYAYRDTHYITFGTKLLIPKNISEKTILITTKIECRYVDGDLFENNLEVILQNLIDIIKINFNKLKISAKSLEKELFFQSFKSKILQELQNEYFDFNSKKISKNKVAIFLEKKNNKE